MKVENKHKRNVDGYCSMVILSIPVIVVGFTLINNWIDFIALSFVLFFGNVINYIYYTMVVPYEG